MDRRTFFKHGVATVGVGAVPTTVAADELAKRVTALENRKTKPSLIDWDAVFKAFELWQWELRKVKHPDLPRPVPCAEYYASRAKIRELVEQQLAVR